MRMLASAALVLAACSSPVSAGTGYDLTEFAISGPEVLASGQSNLTVSNPGEFPHTLVIADRTGTVVAATGLIQPGETTELDVDLSNGQFQFTCRIVAQKPDGELVDHFEAGMSTIVRVED